MLRNSNIYAPTKFQRVHWIFFIYHDNIYNVIYYVILLYYDIII